MTNHLHALFTTLWGWILIGFTSLWAMLKPEIYPFVIVFLSVLLDLIWGIAAAIKQKRFIYSEGIRETCKKLIIYASMLILLLLIERMIHEQTLIATRLACVLAAASELWSVSANMLIIKPDMPFLKIFRLQLKGEIEKKIGLSTDTIFKEKEDADK